jgi:hypothetical protein
VGVPAFCLRQTFVDGEKIALVKRGEQTVGQPLKPPMRVLIKFYQCHWMPYRVPEGGH